MPLISRIIDKRIANYQRDLIETHYKEVDNMYKQIRGFRHDYKNHIQTMKSFLLNNDLESIRNYLEKLDTELSSIDSSVKTGNKMTDAILNSKVSLARSKNIKVLIDASVSVALTISELDLCIIIGNLFDNAIEASLKLPIEDRLIRIYITMKNTQLYMSFTNFTATKKLNKENGKFLSTKGSGHGFGLVRIDDIVSRYNGYISRNSEDNAFTTEILLPQK